MNVWELTGLNADKSGKIYQRKLELRNVLCP